jgi:hypothetical protein
VFAVATILALPMFWKGFVAGKLIWLLPGVAIVLLARFFIPARARHSAQAHAPGS